MGHERKLVLGGVSLTRMRTNRHSSLAAKQVMKEIEELMTSIHYLHNAPFQWIGLIFHYGIKNDLNPKYKKINKKYKDLPVIIELDANDLLQKDFEGLKKIFMIATLKVLIDIGQKYKLPIDVFLEELERLEGP